MTRGSPLGQTFEAIVFDWDGTAVPDRSASAAMVRERLERLSQRGVHTAIVTGTHVGNVDGQLRARPTGPGILWLCVNRGSEVFVVGREGPSLVTRLQATERQERALDAAAERTVERLAEAGVPAAIVSQRLNRRKIDLIPEPLWADPPKARIGELLKAVSARLAAARLGNLSDAVALALDASREVGLDDARVTSDVKHVEIGISDKSDSVRWVLEQLYVRGIGPGLVLLLGDEFGPVGGATGSDALMCVAPRMRAVSVGVEPEGVPPSVLHLGGGPQRFLELLDEQLERRDHHRAPTIDYDPAFTVDAPEHLPPRVRASLLTIADGYLGTRMLTDGATPAAFVVASGAYRGEDSGLPPKLATLPTWCELGQHEASALGRCTLDLRTGVLTREGADHLRAVYFSSLARPGCAAMRAEWPRDAPRITGTPPWTSSTDVDGGRRVTATAFQTEDGSSSTATLERFASYRLDDAQPGAQASSPAPKDIDFERLLAEQREAWSRRWQQADVRITGDDELTRDVRFALFHVMSSVRDHGEAGVGARGLSGDGYDGHVFWDAEVFVLPFLAATHPAAAKAMLSYRLNRLSAARQAASEGGHAGARFSWESAMSGRDVTPRVVHGPLGEERIYTGDEEEHIVADVAWATDFYLRWSGDHEFERGDGHELLVETARYWASRISIEGDGRGHIRRVIGPDEYHEHVDDNAFTNVMARWNLRRAAVALRKNPRSSHDATEANHFSEIARALVDGFDPATRLYEQFHGFHSLEPLLVTELATPPVAADLLLGRERVRGAQVIKQADTLMLHHLVPEELAAGSLRPNLAYYLPRTAHGSSLSPAIHASLLARAGDSERALSLLRLASRIDLDDLTNTTGSGLHLATMGGLWQAIVFGFLGIRASLGGVLEVAPRLPPEWEGVRAHLQLRGVAVALEVRHETIEVSPSGELVLSFSGHETRVGPEGALFERKNSLWEREAPCPRS